MPMTALTAIGWLWFFAAPAATKALGSGKATVLQHSLPVLATLAVCALWFGSGDFPHELLPSAFYESNSFKLFGRNFTIYKTIEDHKDEESVLLAAEQLVGTAPLLLLPSRCPAAVVRALPALSRPPPAGAAVVGVAFGFVVGGGFAPALHAVGVLKSYWPPDPIPGCARQAASLPERYAVVTQPPPHRRYEFEATEALQPTGSPRRGASVSATLTPAVATTRTASLFCEALADELAFRSVRCLALPLQPGSLQRPAWGR